MLILHNVRKVQSNMRKKNKRNHQIWQIQLGTAQCEDDTIKCEKKINEPPDVTKIQSHVMLALHNVRMIPSNMRKK